MDSNDFEWFLIGIGACFLTIFLLAGISANEGEKACKYANKSDQCELQWMPSKRN